MVMVDLDRKRDDFRLDMKTIKMPYIHMYTNTEFIEIFGRNILIENLFEYEYFNSVVILLS
jgi:hypothetical protein